MTCRHRRTWIFGAIPSRAEWCRTCGAIRGLGYQGLPASAWEHPSERRPEKRKRKGKK